jgi:putative Holliday junction resolvase
VALDWGRARIGVAATDPEAILAFPVETVAAVPNPWPRLAELIEHYRPIEIVLGLPRNLAGAEGPAALAIRDVSVQLAAVVPGVPIRLLDERLTTVTASRQLTGAGRNTRRQRSVIDQAAAVALLEEALRSERLTGKAPGELVEPSTAGEDDPR